MDSPDVRSASTGTAARSPGIAYFSLGSSCTRKDSIEDAVIRALRERVCPLGRASSIDERSGRGLGSREAESF